MIEYSNTTVIYDHLSLGRFESIVVSGQEARLYRDGELYSVIPFNSMYDDYERSILYLFKSATDNSYYKPHDVSAWDLIESVLEYYGNDLSPSECFDIGNILKYLLRFKYKGQALSDLDKAIDYLKRVKREQN